MRGRGSPLPERPRPHGVRAHQQIEVRVIALVEVEQALDLAAHELGVLLVEDDDLEAVLLLAGEALEDVVIETVGEEVEGRREAAGPLAQRHVDPQAHLLVEARVADLEDAGRHVRAVGVELGRRGQAHRAGHGEGERVRVGRLPHHAQRAGEAGEVAVRQARLDVHPLALEAATELEAELAALESPGRRRAPPGRWSSAG